MRHINIITSCQGGTMLEILQHTPVWVYIVFVVLLYLSIRACFSHEVNTRQAIIFPLVFILLCWAMVRFIFRDISLEDNDAV